MFLVELLDPKLVASASPVHAVARAAVGRTVARSLVAPARGAIIVVCGCTSGRAAAVTVLTRREAVVARGVARACVLARIRRAWIAIVAVGVAGAGRRSTRAVAANLTRVAVGVGLTATATIDIAVCAVLVALTDSVPAA